jgi:hypothetical protein
MVMFVPEVRQTVSPGAPAPITFGMNKDPSQSMSLTPGGGNMGMFGGGYASGGGVPSSAVSNGGAGGLASTLNTSLSIKDLAPVNVSAITTSGPSGLDFYTGGGSPGSGAGPSFGAPSAPLHVTDLAPTHVTAQMPAPTNWFDNYMMWSHDHPVVSKLAENVAGGAIPLLSPVLVAAHAYYNNQHGKPLLGDLFGDITGAFRGLGSLGSGPGSPLSSNDNNPLFADLYNEPTTNLGMSGGGGGSGPISGTPSIASSGALPNYPGLSALSGGSAPVGGFWNQRALRDASPVYGPYAGFAQGAAPNPSPYGLPPALAPTGIRGS